MDKLMLSAVVLLSCWACSRAGPESNQPTVEERREGQQSVWTGSFHLLWGDPPPSRPGSPQARYQLVTEQGEVISLVVSDSALAELGGARGLNGKRVTVTGERKEGTVSVKSIELAEQGP